MLVLGSVQCYMNFEKKKSFWFPGCSFGNLVTFVHSQAHLSLLTKQDSLASLDWMTMVFVPVFWLEMNHGDILWLGPSMHASIAAGCLFAPRYGCFQWWKKTLDYQIKLVSCWAHFSRDVNRTETDRSVAALDGLSPSSFQLSSSCSVPYFQVWDGHESMVTNGCTGCTFTGRYKYTIFKCWILILREILYTSLIQPIYICINAVV